jgi:hypothetical protein
LAFSLASSAAFFCTDSETVLLDIHKRLCIGILVGCRKANLDTAIHLDGSISLVACIEERSSKRCENMAADMRKSINVFDDYNNFFFVSLFEYSWHAP